MGFAIGTANRGIVMRKQTSFGTVGSGTQYFGLIDDESFQTTYDINARADMTRYGAHTTKTGKRYAEGSINMALDDSPFAALLFNGIFQKITTSGSTDPYTHVMTEATHDEGFNATETFPVFQCIILRDEKQHTYSDMSINRLSISASVGEYVMLSADFVGKAEDSSALTDIAAESGAFDPTINFEPVHFQSGEIFFRSGSNTTKSSTVTSFSLEFNLNRDVDASFALGDDTCVREAPPQLREVTGTVEFQKVLHSTSVEEPLYGNLVDAGSDSVYQPGSSNPAIKLVLTSTTNHDTIIELFKCQWESPQSNVSGRDNQTMSLNFTALYDVTADVMAQVTIRNATATL